MSNKILSIFVFIICVALVDSQPIDDQSKVTNEVLKRAENAIFARAINAIRPIEIKKICPERQKLYSNDTPTAEHEKSPGNSPVIAHVEKPTDNLLQITVLNTEQERSVEIKSNTRQKRNKTPVRSIKERLGKKLNDDVKSRSRTPQRKVITDARNERARSKSREKRSRENERRRDTVRDRRYRSPKSNDTVPRRSDNNQKSSDRIGNYREKERRRENSENRDTKDQKDMKKPNRERERDRNEKTTPPRDLGRDEQKNQIEKPSRDTERDRELQKARVRARIREEERTKEKLGNYRLDAFSRRKHSDHKNNVNLICQALVTFFT